MGIRHLITFLSPYSELEPLAGRDVVIDGPALSYHIYHRCLGWRQDARNAFEAAPTYEELQTATIEWLHGLRDSGAIVKKLYFDGFLPPSKFNTRLKRLEAQTKRLLDYHSIRSIPCRALSDSVRTDAPSIFIPRSLQQGIANFPASSFLVPAILEALKTSEYQSITEVVPGEADAYCARYLKQHGGLVCTGDSDLLVYDLGPNGAVSFFSDIDRKSGVEPVALRSQIYHPASIGDKLGLPRSHGLLALAFEISMDDHGTFPILTSRACELRSVKENPKMYEEFSQEYKPTRKSEVEPSNSVSKIFQSLDPRISEIVLQSPSLAQAAGQHAQVGVTNSKTILASRGSIVPPNLKLISGNPTSASPLKLDLGSESSQSPPHMFLPVLLDWPSRTSAWEMSTSIRQLAYGLLNLILPETERQLSIFEHRRQQGKSSGREWRLPSIAEIPEACMVVMSTLDQLQAMLPDAHKSDLWLATAIHQEIEWTTSLDRTPQSPLVLKQLCDLQDSSKDHKTASWDIIHFLAQVQGSYYSFRILKQIAQVVIAYRDSTGNAIPDAVQNVHHRLTTLPGFCDVPDVRSLASLYRSIEDCRAVHVAYETLGIEKPKPEPLESKRSAKRKRKRQAAGGVPSIRNRTSANPFDLLDAE